MYVFLGIGNCQYPILLITSWKRDTVLRPTRQFLFPLLTNLMFTLRNIDALSRSRLLLLSSFFLTSTLLDVELWSCIEHKKPVRDSAKKFIKLRNNLFSFLNKVSAQLSWYIKSMKSLPHNSFGWPKSTEVNRLRLRSNLVI